MVSASKVASVTSITYEPPPADGGRGAPCWAFCFRPERSTAPGRLKLVVLMATILSKPAECRAGPTEGEKELTGWHGRARGRQNDQHGSSSRRSTGPTRRPDRRRRGLSAYYDLTPDPDNPDQQVAFGTSGHRGSSLDTAFNDAHIAATTQAIVEYRASQGITGPLYIGKDTHALSLPAWKTAIEVLVANGVTVLAEAEEDYTPTPAVSRAIVVHNADRDRWPTWPTASWSPRPTTRPATAASSTTRRTAARPTPTRPPGSRLGPTQLLADMSGGAAGRRTRDRSETCTRFDYLGRLLRGPGQRAQPARHPRRRGAHRRRPARRRQRAVLGLHRRAPRHRPDRGQPQGRPAVGLHDPGHRRQDPDGLLLAQRDGQPDHEQGRVRHLHRQRRRLRPARHRHPGLRA